jgi:hypothetical protein
MKTTINIDSAPWECSSCSETQLACKAAYIRADGLIDTIHTRRRSSPRLVIIQNLQDLRGKVDDVGPFENIFSDIYVVQPSPSGARYVIPGVPSEYLEPREVDY